MTTKTDKLLEQLIAEVKALRAELAARPNVVQFVPYNVAPAPYYVAPAPAPPVQPWQIY